MVRFVLNTRTLQMEIQKPRKPTVDELLQKVKRVHYARIKDAQMTDAELREAIDKALKGTRNITYLAPKDKLRERAEILYFILRNT